MTLEELRKYIIQANYTLLTHRKAIEFTFRHKLWLGFWKYGWVSRGLLVVAILAGLKLAGIFLDWWKQLHADSVSNVVSSMGMLANTS